MIELACLGALALATTTAVVQPEEDTDTAQGWDEIDAAEDAGEPLEPDAAPAPAEPGPAAPTKQRFNRWSLQIAPGAEFIFAGEFNAYGPNFRFGAWVHAWRGKFMIGGGPALHYTYLVDNTDSGDKVQLFTVNGDMVIGGGKADKIAGFGHITLGAGAVYGKDGQTGASLAGPAIRFAAGPGLHGFVHRMVSLGALVDFSYYPFVGLGMDAFLTVGIHFKPKPK